MSTSEQSQVVRLHRTGAPEVLQIESVPTPQPDRGEVRVKVDAIGLNRIEAAFRAGEFGMPRFPTKIGYEAAGSVDALGAGVTDWAVGDRVAVLPGIAMDVHGTYGEHIILPAEMLVRVADFQSMEEAAATWMAYITAFPLHEAELKPEMDVVISAASSSVGIAAIQIVRAAGARPIAVTRSRAKAKGLQDIGAAEVIVADEVDLTEGVRAVTDGGAALVFDAVAGSTLPKLIAGLRPGGGAIVYGSLAGAKVTLDAQQLMLGAQTVRGFAAFQVSHNVRRRNAAVAFINAGITSGRLKPVIDRAFPFAAVSEAHHYLEANNQTGKIILRLE